MKVLRNRIQNIRELIMDQKAQKILEDQKQVEYVRREKTYGISIGEITRWACFLIR